MYKTRFVTSYLDDQQKQHDPGKVHWETIKWILRYIKGTIYVGLMFEKYSTGIQECIKYIDSDYTGDLYKRQSTTGYVSTLAQASVSWCSILESTVTLSTTEVEYMTISESMKEKIWLQALLVDLRINQDLL